MRAADAAGNLGPFSDPATATTPAPPPVGPGPIKVSANGRYLVDEHGKPWLMLGESPQAMVGDLTEADAETFFAARKAQGFNAVLIDLVCKDYTGCRPDGQTWDGMAPFNAHVTPDPNQPYDLSTPNEAYFAHADRIDVFDAAQAAHRGD